MDSRPDPSLPNLRPMGAVMTITGPLLSLVALLATARSDSCIHEGVPRTIDLVGEGIGDYHVLFGPQLSTICTWATADGGTYNVVSIEPALTVAFYLGVVSLVVGIALLLSRRRAVSKP